jgi:hypothetical protein
MIDSSCIQSPLKLRFYAVSVQLPVSNRTGQTYLDPMYHG